MALPAALGVGMRVEGYLDPSEDPVATSMSLQARPFFQELTPITVTHKSMTLTDTEISLLGSLQAV